MRVDAYMKVNEVYQTSKPRKVGKVEQSSNTDTLEISQIGKDYQVAKLAIKNTPDIREDKVKEIMSALESGTYDVTIEDVTDKLLSNIY